MQLRLLLSCLLSITLLHCSTESFRVLQQPLRHVDRSLARSRAAPQPQPVEVKEGEEPPAKQLRLDQLAKMENDVMEPKRKRSSPGNTVPLDRLSVNSMETKQTSNKQSKVVASPRRRANLPPIDRIGMSRLPNSRG